MTTTHAATSLTHQRESMICTTEVVSLIRSIALAEVATMIADIRTIDLVAAIIVVVMTAVAVAMVVVTTTEVAGRYLKTDY